MFKPSVMPNHPSKMCHCCKKQRCRCGQHLDRRHRDPLKEGTTTIKATFDGSNDATYESGEASYELTVKRGHPSLQFPTGVNGNQILKDIGEANFTYEATLYPDIEGAVITYKSSNEGVASVDSITGEVTLGATEGWATITATFAGNDQYEPSSASYGIELCNPILAGAIIFNAEYNSFSSVEGTSYAEGTSHIFIAGNYLEYPFTHTATDVVRVGCQSTSVHSSSTPGQQRQCP